ncbi:TonB family protein [Gloeocapsa sp. PCC 73106]|uniref:TonB family protein n=1 Tax=Gloeocapsa sp. PCC 73106 TaxID=102232 RepID=UPI0002ABE3BD|nr:TonB family protein [Gloeocapsa sp. PCC 73106]ELR99671.1 TonB family protein [Gloeocapsa sp. PCC 73106]
MSKYYTSNWLQTRSVGIFISAAAHLLLLGIILPRLGTGDGTFLKGKRQLRNIDLISLTPAQQKKLPSAVLPPTPEVTETVPNSTSIITDTLPLPVNLDLETIPLPPPLEIPPPPPVGVVPAPTLPGFSLLPIAAPPIPRELIEIINPQRDSFSSPKLIQPEVIPEPEPVIVTQPTLPPQQREDNLLASVQAKAQLLKYDVSDTKISDVQKNYQSWLAGQEQDNPQKIAWQGNYPRDGCIKKVQGTTVYGVLVDPKGKIINLQLIQSAGYPLLNQQAAQQIEAFNFTPTSAIQPYVVTVEFAYNANLCPSLSVSP